MSYIFENSSPYSYGLYTSGGELASVDFDTLTQHASAINYIIIVDISNTIQGTYSYSINDVEQGTITKADCPFLISDISGFSTIGSSISFTPSENRDGYGSILYYIVSRYTPIVKTQIRQVSRDNTITQELLYNTYGYTPFERMNTSLYAYFLVKEPDRIILLDTAATTDTSLYSNTIGIPILNNDGSLHTQWSPVLDELGYGPKDNAIYENTNHYYLIPLALEFFEDGSYSSYVNENLIVLYDVSAGSVYKYTPESRTIGAGVYDDGSLVGGGVLEEGRSVALMRDSNGSLLSPVRVYYGEYKDKIYRPYQYKYNFQHENRPPTITDGAVINIASYNANTIGSAVGVSVAEICALPSLAYNDPNVEYNELRGLIVGMPSEEFIEGAWAYRLGGETEWTTMNFTDENSNIVYWYLPEKKWVGGAQKDVYLKFITSMNKTGNAALVTYAWDRSNVIGPVEGPVAAPLLSYSENGAVSAASVLLVQTNVKINYAPTYDNTIGNTYVSVNQDTAVVISFDDAFFNAVGYMDASGAGPGMGVVLEDVSGGGFGTWSWRYQNDVNWRSFSFGGGNSGFHVKKFNAGQNNVLVRFISEKYKFGTALFRARLWDTSIDVPNGTYAIVPSVYDANGAYSATAKTWNVVVQNVADPPKLYDGSGNTLGSEVGETYTKNYITYVKGYTPSDTGEDSIFVSQILSEFAQSRIFGARLIDVDNGFVEFDYTTLGIAIEDISASDVDISFQRLVSTGIWRSYSKNDFFADGLYKYLHLNYNDVIRFKKGDSILGDDSVAFRFRVWNRRNASFPSIVGSINLYNTITTTGPYYSIPIRAGISYNNQNHAPIVNINGGSYTYDLGVQSEDSGDSINFDIGEIIERLRTTTVNGRPLISDAEGEYITQIPLFGLALVDAPAVMGFSDAGAWKYRADTNSPAETIDFRRGYFHVTAGGGGACPKLFYSPTKHTHGTIQLTARIWDRSNEADVSAGMYDPYNGTFNHIQPYSSKTIVFQLNITNVNDRPYVVSGRLFLRGISFTNMNPEGQTIYDIMRTSDFVVGDPDPQDIGSHGLAIMGLSFSALGAWQYMLDGVHWLDIPVQNGKALHLDPMTRIGTADINVRLRFVPNSTLSRNILGVRVFQFYIWDKTNGVSQGSFQPIQPQSDSSYSLISYTGRIIVGV